MKLLSYFYRYLAKNYNKDYNKDKFTNYNIKIMLNESMSSTTISEELT